MQVLILAGGAGTRAYPFTEYLPKPMMPVGGKPVVVRVMELYASQGFTEFILSVGHRKEVIIDYFNNRVTGWDVKVVDTGQDTDTGGRLLKCRDLLGETFMATYADGISDVPLGKLVDFHHNAGTLGTVTCVPLRSQYGTVSIDGDNHIAQFREKPVLQEYWINAGFFVMNRAIFDHWQGDNLEKDVFPNLLAGRHLSAFRHTGFFKSMDTYKDQQEMEALFVGGVAPWMTPEPAAA